jgi:hypothetical protein
MKPVTVVAAEDGTIGVYLKKIVGSCNYISGGWFYKFGIAPRRINKGDKLTFTLKVTKTKKQRIARYKSK